MKRLFLAICLILPCPQMVYATGACCNDEGECTIVADESACETLVAGAPSATNTAYYEGDSSTCDPNPCEVTFVQPITPSTRERYVFRNGYLTDGATAGPYDGIRFLMIDAQNVSTNYESNESVYIGNDGVGEYRALLSIDISALPDSFYVDRATLYFLRVDEGSNPSVGNTWATQDHGYIGVYRLLTPWVSDEVTWAEASSGVSWYGAGTLNDSNGTRWRVFGASANVPFRTDQSTLMAGTLTTATVTPPPKIAGYYVGIGADTLRWQSQVAPADRPFLPDYTIPIKGRHFSYTADPVWCKVKITDITSFYHRNPDQNLGWVLILDDTNLAAGHATELRGTAATIPDEAPFLVVEGVDVTTETGGGGRGKVVKIGSGGSGGMN